MARLQAGTIDAGVRPTKPPARGAGLPFISLPGNPPRLRFDGEGIRASERHVNGKVHHPQPIGFYAAVVKMPPQPNWRSVCAWLQRSRSAPNPLGATTTTTWRKPSRGSVKRQLKAGGDRDH